MFLRDLLSGETTLISATSSGVSGNGASNFARISADGRYVTFNSAASNLVAGDSNGVNDVFVRDLVTGITSRVSESASGVQGNATSSAVYISGDGRYVSFSSTATNLVSGDTNGFSDVFVKDMSTGLVTRVMTNSGAQAKVTALALDLAERVLASPPEHGAWEPDAGAPPAVAALLGTWWTEGYELVLSWRGGRLRSELLGADVSLAPEAPSRGGVQGPDRAEATADELQDRGDRSDAAHEPVFRDPDDARCGRHDEVARQRIDARGRCRRKFVERDRGRRRLRLDGQPAHGAP